MFRGSSLSKLTRFGCGGAGLIALAFGLHFARSNYAFSYRNWFGGVVFAPIAILLGTVAVLGSIFNWQRIWDSPPRVARKKRN